MTLVKANLIRTIQKFQNTESAIDIKFHKISLALFQVHVTTFMAFGAFSVLAMDPVVLPNETSSGAHQNMSERMRIVISSMADPLFVAGINITLYCTPILIVLGIIGNTMALLVVTRKKNREISCCTYMAALAICDTGSLLCFGYLWCTIVMSTIWSVSGCIGWVYIVFLNTAGSGFLLVGVTFDRFIAICFPFKGRVWCTPKRARIMVACIIAFVSVFYIPMAIMANVVDGNVCVAFGHETTANVVLANINLIALPIIPFFVLLIMNIMIILAVRRSGDFKATAVQTNRTSVAGKVTDQDGAAKQTSGSRDRQLTVMLVTVSCAYVIIILPISVRVLVYSFVNQYASPRRYAVFVFLYAVINQILFLNNTINFYLYFLTGSKFRKDLKQLLLRVKNLCWKPDKKKDMQMSSSSGSGAQFYRTIPTYESTTDSTAGEVVSNNE